MRKTRSKKGFTLAELLIVVAVIAILVAIAIPVFSAQLENAREAVDRANARTAESLASADYLLNHSGSTTPMEYKFKLNKAGNIVINSASDEASIKGKSKKCDLELKVKVGTGGEIEQNTWTDQLDSPKA